MFLVDNQPEFVSKWFQRTVVFCPISSILWVSATVAANVKKKGKKCHQIYSEEKQKKLKCF